MNLEPKLDAETLDLATHFGVIDNDGNCFRPVDLYNKLKVLFVGNSDVLTALLAEFDNKVNGNQVNVTTQKKLLEIAAEGISHKITAIMDKGTDA